MSHRISEHNNSDSLDRQREGFTLIELVMSILVCGVIGLSIAFPLLEVTKSYQRLQTRNALRSQARTALDLMTREFRTIGLSSGNPDLSTAAVSEVVFGTKAYRLASANLERSENSGGTYFVLASNVSALALSYADEVGSALTSLPLSSSDRNSVRRIAMEITVTANGETVKLRSSVHLRSFAY